MISVLQKLVQTYPRLIILLFGLAFVIGLVPATKIQIHPGLDYFLLQNDPDRARNQEIKAEFKNDEMLMVGIDLGRPLTASDLALLASLRREIESLPSVSDVIDLTSVEDVRADEQGFLDTSGLVGEELLAGTATPEELAASFERLLARIDGHRLVDGNLIADDRRAVSMFIVPTLEGDRASGAINQEVVTDTARILERAPWATWVGGYPAAEVDSTRIGLRDLGVLTSAALVLVLILAVTILRHWGVVLFVGVLAAWSNVLATAWLSLVGAPFTAVSATLPTILVATAGAYGLYAFALLRSAGAEDPFFDLSPGARLVARLARPCTISALSTSAGFLSLTLMPIEVLKHLGAGLAVGILGALAASLLLLPALAQVFGFEPPPPRRIQLLSQIAQYGVERAERPWRAVLVTLLLVAVVVGGVFRLRLESDPITYWKADSFHRLSDGFLSDRFDGSLWVNLVLSTEEGEGALAPSVLRFAHGAIETAMADPIVTRSVSLLDYLALIDDAMNPEPPGEPDSERRYFTSPALAAQYMVLYESSGSPEDFEYYVNFDRSALNVFLKVDSRSSKAVLDLRQRLLGFAAETPTRPANLDVEVLGTWLLFPKAMDGIVRNMLRGLAVAVALITLLMMASLRSFKLGLLSMIPNVVPIATCLGLMGWTGIPLSFVTSITGCLALGLAVDDTAHVLGHLGGKGNHHPRQALSAIYERVGPALLVTTVCLGLGFLVLLFSDFQPIAHMGLATAITLVVALAADLFLLPSLLRLVGWPLHEAELHEHVPEKERSESAPAAIARQLEARRRAQAGVGSPATLVVLLLGLSVALGTGHSRGTSTEADSALAPGTKIEGLRVAQLVNARSDGETLRESLEITVRDARGRERHRKASVFRRYDGDRKQSLIRYVEPVSVRGTAFLTWDYGDGKADDQWLYLPEYRRVRRISASNRGESFLGTDFTYENIKNEMKVELDDYNWQTVGWQTLDDCQCIVVDGLVKSRRLAKVLGHERATRWVDSETWLTRRVEYWTGQTLERTITAHDIRKVDGIDTVHRLECINHATGGSTTFRFSDVAYDTDLSTGMFQQEALEQP